MEEEGRVASVDQTASQMLMLSVTIGQEKSERNLMADMEKYSLRFSLMWLYSSCHRLLAVRSSGLHSQVAVSAISGGKRWGSSSAPLVVDSAHLKTEFLLPSAGHRIWSVSI